MKKQKPALGQIGYK